VYVKLYTKIISVNIIILIATKIVTVCFDIRGNIQANKNRKIP